jgi:GSCFA family
MFKNTLTFDVAAYYQRNNGVCGFSYTDELLCIGSCFAQNMGGLLVEHKFNTSLNPYGITFNPLLIAQQLNNAIDNIPINDNAILHTDGLYFSYLAHSSIHATNKEALVQQLQAIQQKLFTRIKNAHYLILTWGSAFYYTRSTDGAMVNNCHKQPQTQFTKHMCTSTQIEIMYNNLIQKLRAINPQLQVLLTVSPVRYVRDGVVENNLSKAQLITATHAIIKSNENVFYFPAYELVIDDLRDYRYYTTDYVHPSAEAVQYVWQVFISNLLSRHDVKLFEQVQRIIQAAKHNTLHPQSLSNTTFKKQYAKLCTQLMLDYPHINLNVEYAKFTSLNL